MEYRFWRFAHRRYQLRSPSILSETAAGTWLCFFVIVYAGALAKGWVPNLVEAVVAVLLIGLPAAFISLHRRIRIEKAKGGDALYRKLIAVTRSNLI